MSSKVEFLHHHKQVQLYRLMYNDIEQDEGTPLFCSDFARLGHESIEITYKTYSHFLPGDDGGSSEDWGEKSGRAEGHLQPASRCLILIFCHG